MYEPQKIDYKWIFEYDKDKVYGLKKSSVGSFAGHKVVTNSYGHRDSEIPIEKPTNTIRILVVGDSITFGHGVSGDDTYTECLEHMLNQTGNPYRFDVINAAVPGNSPFQEYHDLKRSLKLDPDIVIIQFTLNDVVEPYRIFKRYGGKGKDYHLVEDIPYYDYILSQNSAFYLFLKDVINKITHQAPTEEALRTKAQEREIYSTKNMIAKHDDPRIQEAWEECLKWMQKIVDLCQEENVECILFISPFAFQFTMDESYAHPQSILQDFSTGNSVVYMDLLHVLQEAFRQEMTEKYMFPEHLTFQEVIHHLKRYNTNEPAHFWQRYFLDYDHYNVSGHEYVATILYETSVDLLKTRGIRLE
ncbi:MAG: SGNH/GDSL hydrolase family protein [Deltaproteobacteria bacterium]|nr:SGNH/GDSL hydrolase family protein [Deltaproteobacteria bacterium]